MFLTIIAIYYFTGKNYSLPIIAISGRTWMATFFFLFGHAWRENEERGGFLARFDKLSIAWQIAVVAVLAAIVEICLQITGFMQMIDYSVGRAPFVFMIGAICGTMMVTYVCRWIVSRPQSIASQFLTFTGRQTFAVLTWHMSCFKLISLLIVFVYGLEIERIAVLSISTKALQQAGIDVSWTLWWVAYTIVGAGVPILWQYVRMKQGKEKRRY